LQVHKDVDRTYIGEKEFHEKFLCYECDVIRWREYGMPHVMTNGVYEYNVTDCQAWFAGTYWKPTPRKQIMPISVDGCLVHSKAQLALHIGGKILRECRLAGMPHIHKGNAYFYNIKECLAWLEQSEAFKNRIKWRMKRGENSAGE